MVSHKVINHLWYKYDPFNIPWLRFFFPPLAFHKTFQRASSAVSRGNDASNPNRRESEASITKEIKHEQVYQSPPTLTVRVKPPSQGK